MCNAVPIAVDDQVEFFGRTISVEAMANDRELDGEALELSVTSVGTCTSASSSSSSLAVSVDNGIVRLTPIHPGHVTNCTLTYEIEDEHGSTDTAQIFIHPPSFFFADGFETGNTSKWCQTQTAGGGVEP